jgi:molybdenum ABC transporter molybdate-binding protein
LQPALRRVARLFAAAAGPAPVHLFSAPSSLMLAQIERQTQTDLLITTITALDDAARGNLIKSGTRVGAWRDGLVIAGRRDDPSGSDIARLVGDGRLAVTDPTLFETFDGPAVLARLGLADALTHRLIGAANTAEVVFLVKTGAARLGLMQRTDALADPSLVVALAVPEDACPPLLYGAAITVTAASPKAQPFIDFLGSEQARSQLRSDGLEWVA